MRFMIKMASVSDFGYIVRQMFKEYIFALNFTLNKFYDGGYINV